MPAGSKRRSAGSRNQLSKNGLGSPALRASLSHRAVAAASATEIEERDRSTRAAADQYAEGVRASADETATRIRSDADAYAACLREALTDEQIREGTIDALTGDWQGADLAALGRAQTDCAAEATPADPA